MSITKEFFSGSTNGRPISVVATSSPGTTVHTAVASTSTKDEVWLFATNTTTVDVLLTIQFGGTTSPDDKIQFTVQPGDTVTVIAGVPINNSLIVKAFAATTVVINVFGYVNRIT